MRKPVSPLLILIICAMVFTGCGEKPAAESDAAADQRPASADGPEDLAGPAGPPPPAAPPLAVWALNEGIRINPLTGRAFEEDSDKTPGGVKGNYRQKNLIWDFAARTISLKGAANEVLGFQLILEGPGINGINVTATDLVSKAGARIPAEQMTFFRAFYIHAEPGKPTHGLGPNYPLGPAWFPDPLVPLDAPKGGAPFAIDGSNFGGTKPEGIRNQTVWADLWVPKNTPRGIYTGKITVASSAGPVTLLIELEVFGFEVPDEAHLTFEIESYKHLQKLPERDQIYIHAHQHRATITMATYHISDYYEPRLTNKNGKFIWKGFDSFYGPSIDGSLYKTGPRAGVPEPFFNLPFGPAIARPDKRLTYEKSIRRAWPIANPVKNDNLEVDFTPEYVKEFTALVKDASAHFAEKYPGTTIITYNDNMDEAGFQGPGWARRTEQSAMALLRNYQGFAKIFKDIGAKNILFKLDMGSGFSHCGFDLDGDGTMEGPRDVVDALPDVGLWSITAGRIRLKALEPVMKKGVPVWFYNAGRRLGRAAMDHEGLAPRTWAWVAWNSPGTTGFMKYNCLIGYSDKAWEKGGNPFLFFYPGKDIGIPDTAFVSMRLKGFRRGLQDYEYLHLFAEKAGDREKATDYSLKVVQNAVSRRLDLDRNNQVDDEEDHDNKALVDKTEKDTRHWSHNPEDFDKVRYELGEALGK